MQIEFQDKYNGMIVLIQNDHAMYCLISSEYIFSEYVIFTDH